jgi:hypothetical protein
MSISDHACANSRRCCGPRKAATPRWWKTAHRSRTMPETSFTLLAGMAPIAWSRHLGVSPTASAYVALSAKLHRPGTSMR